MNEPEDRTQSLAARAGWWALALIPLLLGFALRLWYALHAEPFVDEPTTLLVAQAVAGSGTPTLPSGLFYGNDLPFSYLAGGLVALCGPHLVAIRLLSVAASVATLGLVGAAGRRLFSPWAGLWAALLLALNPQAIIWGGRARAYGLLGLLAFLAVWLFYRGVMASKRPAAGLSRQGDTKEGGAGPRRMGLVLLVVAAFVHPEAALLLPALAAGAMLVAGWRWWLRPVRLAELILAALGVSARYWLQLALARGQIGGFETVTGSRPPLELAGDWLSRLEQVAPFFLDPAMLPWTILALVALGGAIWNRARAQERDQDRAVLFFSACLWLVPAGMVLLLGSSYQSPRYLSLLLPVFALLAAAGLHRLVAGLAKWPQIERWRGVLAILVAVLLAAVYMPGAVAAANTTEKGFRPALATVGEAWQPGDRVATVAPATSQLVLGRSDFFALGLEYEEFVFRDDEGRLVERWLGSPLIRTAGELEAVLDEGGRLWFVADEGRLRRRFEPEFAQAVWERMELVAKIDGVLVFRSHTSPEAAISRPVGAVFGGQVELTGYDLGLGAEQPAEAEWGEVIVRPGEGLPLTLYWQATGPVRDQYTLFVHLLGADGQRYAQDDGPPLDGRQPMTHWLVGEILPDRRALDLPADLPPGRYRLEIGLYRPEDGERLPVTGAGGHPLGGELVLDYVRVLEPGDGLPEPAQPVDAVLSGPGKKGGQDQIRLMGYDLASETAEASGSLGLTLYWQAVDRVGSDYTVFVHLLDGDDQIRGQGDGLPAGGQYPTSFWDPGEVVVDERQLKVDADTPPGVYRLAVGLYLPASDQRLVHEGGDRVMVGEVRIER